MANNQWKSFQSPPSLHSQESASIFDFKSMIQQASGMQGNYRSITGAGANTGGGGGGGGNVSTGGLLGGSGSGGPFGSGVSSHSGGGGGFNHLNMSLFGAKSDLHGSNNSMFSSASYNAPSASVPPPMNYNMFSSSNSNNNNNMANNRFPTIGTFSASNPASNSGGGGMGSNPHTSMNGVGGHNNPALSSMNGLSPLSNGPNPTENVLNIFNGFGGELSGAGSGHHGMNSNSSGSMNGSNNTTNSSNSSQYNDPNNQTSRETGIIEKLLHSYGFIQCCERQARLFFHFSQFSGNIEHLKIGDPVEFEMTYDRRTGKPIASTVSKIAPEVVLSEERVTGTVTTETRAEGATTGDIQGRISYENRGECFFLPYTKDDVEGNVVLRTGDKVSFQIATNPRGNLGASHVRLENPVHPVKYQGVVCSMKENFGFIERADVVKEIFFHFSESKLATEDQLQLGDDVEFNIQTRNGKEVAVNLSLLPRGSVVFEDLTEDIVKGQVLKPLERGLPRHPNTDPLPGRIRYRAPDHSEVEIPFGEKDQRGDFTLKHGGWVQFQVATDRRDSLRRATRISLLHESFVVSGERREQGVVTSVLLGEGYGWVRSAEREPRLLVKLGEVLDRTESEIKVNDEVEFTTVQDNTFSAGGVRGQTQYSAVRLIRLSPGTVQFECITDRNVLGFVTKEASFSWNNRSPSNMSPPQGQDKSQESGVIAYNNVDGAFTKSIIYFIKDCCDPKAIPSLGDKVEFNVCQVKSNKQNVAVEIRKLDLVPASSQQQNQQQQQQQ
uniref:Cold shock domain-containing protein E1 n=1 Tax=Cacopsylla melanoneura TaxID=428564 RepID=A0A8D8YKE2_9HEMI